MLRLVGLGYDADTARERELFERMDAWPDEGTEMQEDMRFLRRRLAEVREDLMRARLHNVQLLRREQRSCIVSDDDYTRCAPIPKW